MLVIAESVELAASPSHCCDGLVNFVDGVISHEAWAAARAAADCFRAQALERTLGSPCQMQELFTRCPLEKGPD